MSEARCLVITKMSTRHISSVLITSRMVIPVENIVKENKGTEITVLDQCKTTIHKLCCYTQETSNNNTGQWLLNSDCSNHLTGKKEVFSKIDESFRSSVNLRDNHEVPISGKEKIAIKLKNKASDYVFEVYYGTAIVSIY